MKLSTIYSISLALVVALTALLPIAEANAQDMRIAFVEPQAILERMPEMSAMQTQLRNFAERKQNEIAQKERELQNEVERFQQRVGVISESAREQQEQRLIQMQQELRELQNNASQELDQRQNQLMNPIIQKLRGAIDEVAAQRGFDYVLNRTTSTGDVVILYVSDRVQNEYDITDAVMQNLGI
ncbi:MAG: OmpH family outer membrane protein [Balneolaceae bacterium]